MPESKHNFTKGKMNKDLDERLVPNGEYKDAMNIQVATSEGSDIGTVQNILGNKIIQIQNLQLASAHDEAFTVSSIADEKNDTLYWLVWTPDTDYIFSYKKTDTEAKIIFRDINKNVLKFNPNFIITGISIIDDMLFWTDNRTEPKKINIPRCRAGTDQNNPTHTKLINDSQGIIFLSNINIEEKHITVIKKTPPTPLEMKLVTVRDPNRIYTGVTTTYPSGEMDESGNFGYNFSSLKVGDFTQPLIEEGIDGFGNVVSLGPGALESYGGLTGWPRVSPLPDPWTPQPTIYPIKVGTKVVLKPFDDDGSPPGLPVTDYVLKAVVEDADDWWFFLDSNHTYQPQNLFNSNVRLKITSIDGYPPQAADGEELKYVIDLFDESEKLFEFKFPRFSYRYKFEDGEYSPFAPFTQVAFSPGSFDYHPRKGYNLGMTNRLKQVELGKFIHDDIPEDVVSIDILFKDEPSPNIYVVDTIKPDDNVLSAGGLNVWDNVKAGNYYVIDNETISSVLPSNQLLRPWDNVPRRALAQDVTGNRIVYGNYVQNYNFLTSNNEKYIAGFINSWDTFPESLTEAGKSIKSLREYQLGVVFTDKYGRETPVISNPSGTIKLEKDRADFNNRIQVQLQGSNSPVDFTHFKFFVKETANEYYNMAMDRWYNAEDGNIWLAFPSSDRNKIDIDSFIILKKGSDQDTLVKDAARYKVIAIENEAPDFIKTSKLLISSEHYTEPGNVLFQSTTSTAPLRGEKNFKLRFQPYFGSSGQNLDRIDDDLYVEFGKFGSTEVSNRYRITSVTNDRDENIAGGVSSADSVDALYSFQLREPLGEDVDFIASSTTNNIQTGALVNIYKYKVESSPKFDGRFFVKIYYDDVFKNNISLATNVTPEYRVTDSRVIYSMSGETHFNKHTANVGHFLTQGIDFPDYQRYPDNANMSYGHYDNDQFTSFALYFRRYKFGTTLLEPQSGFHVTPLHHLTDTLQASSTSSYLNTFWKSVDDGKEFGEPAITGGNQNQAICGYTANFFKRELVPYPASEYQYEEVIPSLSNDNPKDTDVWFIDAGPSAARRAGSDTWLEWYGLQNFQDEDNGGVPNYGNGLSSYPNYWTMLLSYGGIKPTAGWNSNWEENWTNPGFFNVGNWNQLAGDYTNSNYTDSATKEWVGYLNMGNRFRWKHDPTEQIYTIIGANGAGGAYQRLRHSYRGPIQGAGVFGNSTVVLNNSGVQMAQNQRGKGELISFNFTKGFFTIVEPALTWNPYINGKIPGGTTIQLPAVDMFGNTTAGSPTATGNSVANDLKIFVGSISDGTNKLHVGMALEKYYVDGGEEGASPVEAKLNTATHLGTTANEYLVIRHIEDVGTHFELWLGGYSKPMSDTNNPAPNVTAGHGAHRMVSQAAYVPVVAQNYTFVQVGMNGYSDNSEFNINTLGANSAADVGKIGAVGYTLEFVTEILEEDVLSENPAIWETEPKDNVDLDIYYEATGAIPINIDASNIHDAIPIGSNINTINRVVGYAADEIVINGIWTDPLGFYTVIRPDELELNIEVLAVSSFTATQSKLKIKSLLYNTSFKLPWHNCYSFGNGVESNRIRDNFNLAYITNGVKASTTLGQEYKEEHRKYGLIYSGLYNSTSGVNNLNQFIAAEKITKDVNPIYGSIQKLHSRDSDLVTLCEDKCLKILANKDAVFNADGNTNLTATENVLGQTIPFSGEYGISTNPESFASESYRVYFTDKIRGAVMRLSQDGLTAISDHGMKDWFRDNLELLPRVIGSHDDKKNEYNIVLKQTKGDSTMVEILAETPPTIDCSQCDDGTAISNEFLGTTCPEGWQPTFQTVEDSQVYVDPCEDIGEIDCSQCDDSTAINQLFPGVTCPEGWQPTYDYEGILVNPCETVLFGTLDCSACSELGTTVSMTFGEYEFIYGMWDGVNCPDGWIVTGTGDPCATAASWKCVGSSSGGTCIEVFDGSGGFSTPSECEATCGSGGGSGETTGDTTEETTGDNS